MTLRWILSEVQFRKAANADLEGIVDVHIEAFEGFFLTSLGRTFLKKFYSVYINSDDAVFVVMADRDKIGGFAVGSPCEVGFVRQAGFYHAALIALLLIPVVMFNFALLKSVLSRFFAKDSAPNFVAGSFLLRSIGISKIYSGTGLSSQLLHGFESLVSARNFKSLVLTTDAVENDKALGFYKKNKYVVHDSFAQDSKRMMFVLKKTIGELNE